MVAHRRFNFGTVYDWINTWISIAVYGFAPRTNPETRISLDSRFPDGVFSFRGHPDKSESSAYLEHHSSNVQPTSLCLCVSLEWFKSFFFFFLNSECVNSESSEPEYTCTVRPRHILPVPHTPLWRCSPPLFDFLTVDHFNANSSPSSLCKRKLFESCHFQKSLPDPLGCFINTSFSPEPFYYKHSRVILEIISSMDGDYRATWMKSDWMKTNARIQ